MRSGAQGSRLCGASCVGDASRRLARRWPRPGAAVAARLAAASPAHPTFSVAGGRLRIEVCADDIVRVAFAKDEAFFARPSLMAAPRRCTPLGLEADEDGPTRRRSRRRSCGCDVDLTTGAVAFFDAAGTADRSPSGPADGR